MEVPSSADAGVAPASNAEASCDRSTAAATRRDIVAIGTSAGGVVQHDEDRAEVVFRQRGHQLFQRIDHRLPLEGIAALLTSLVQEAPGPFEPWDVPPSLEHEVQMARLSRSTHAMGGLGRLSPFTCPACRGALWELEEGQHLRYRCHTGHGYSQASLLVDQGVAVEEGLYTAMRAVQEKAGALRRLAERWPDRMPSAKAEYEQRASELDQSADVLRAMLAGQKA
ncbi:MAG: hypothetical protein KIT60_23320 [Burkholderiaceae bacterium]|nr:hypothetical protein [Burkholderiaceae bacterium]